MKRNAKLGAGYGKVPINSTGATRPRDIQQAMVDFKPQIVHFSGHGEERDGLAFEDAAGQPKFVNTEALADLFKLFSERVECVVLNACYSEVQAKAIVRHINYVIGMSKTIGDRAAIEFSVGFYTAVGAGESIEFAYQLGCNAIQLEGIPEELTPVLFRFFSERSAQTVFTYPITNSRIINQVIPDSLLKLLEAVPILEDMQQMLKHVLKVREGVQDTQSG